MKPIEFMLRSVVVIHLLYLCAGVALGDIPVEKQNTGAEGPFRQTHRVSPPPGKILGMPEAGPAAESPVDGGLIQALKEARRAGDQAQVTEILDLLSPGEEAVRSGPLIHPIEGPVTRDDGGAGWRWGNDVLVVDSEYLDASPDMVSSSDGELFVVVEHMDNFGIRIYRSLDGGLTWQWYKNLYSLDYDLLDPSLAMPELDQDYLYAIYEFADQIQVARIDLDTDEMVFFNVETNVEGVHHPRITTDNIDYPGNYWLYVVYIADDPNNPIVAFDIKAVRSTDHGQTWGNQHVFNSQAFNWLSEPDITFAGGDLYVVWDAYETITEWGVFACRSPNLGFSWDPWVNLTPTDRTCSYPRVGAIENGQQVVVAYQDTWNADDIDVRFASSTDAGVTWSEENCLYCSFDNERKPDICVDPSLGNFHVVAWMENDIIYSSAPHTDPFTWTAPVTINDTNQANAESIPPSVAVHWTTGEPGIAWPDDRTPTDAIYFDRADFSASAVAGPPATARPNGNSPNPFVLSTHIGFDLSGPAKVTLRIHDVLGRRVTDLLVNEPLPAGRHEVSWDGMGEADAALPSGIYFYVLEAQRQVETGRMVLMRE